MGKRFYISFIFFLFLSPVFIISQNYIVFSELTDESYIFDNETSLINKHSISNYFLRELALGNTSTSTGFSYNYNYQLNKVIINQNKNYSIAKIDIISKSCSGDVYYKGFSVSDELKPSLISFVLDVYSDNVIIASRIYSGIHLDGDKVKMPDFSYKYHYSKQNLNLKIRDIRFKYSDSDKEIFNKKIFLINDYYASVAIIDSSLNYISGFDIKNPAKVFLNCFKRFEVRQIEHSLRAKEFPEKLSLSEYDPVNFTSKLYTFHLQIIKLNTLIDLLLNSEKPILHSPDIAELSTYYISRQLYYIELSQKVNHFFTPSFYNLALQKLTLGDLNDLIKVIYTKKNPSFSQLLIRKKLNLLANNLFDDYLQTASFFLADKRYNEAIDILDNARGLYSNVPSLRSLDRLNHLVTKAKTGVYSSFLRVANKAISIDNFEMAQEYLDKASKFQIKNKDYISNLSNADTAYKKLAEIFYLKGVKNNNNSNYQLALDNFSKASELSGIDMYARFTKNFDSGLANSKTRAIIDDFANKQIVLNAESETNKAIQGVVKNNLIAVSESQIAINESKSLFSQEKFSDALSKLHDAKKLVKDYEKINYQIDSLIERTASSFIMQQVYNAVMFVMDNEYFKAKNLYRSSILLQKKYDFLNREDINNALYELCEMIDESKCKNLENNYEYNLAKGQNAVEQRNYVMAIEFFLEAKNIAKTSSDCKISDSEAQKEYDKYLPAFNYQIKMQDIIEDIYTKGLTSVIDRYRKLGTYYNDSHISRFALTHISFFEFLFTQNNPQLIFNTLDYFTETGQFASSIELLEVLYAQDFPSLLIKSQQKELGKKMAKMDYKSNSKRSPAENISSMMLENKWFSNYCKAYRNEWRKNNISSIFNSPKK